MTEQKYLPILQEDGSLISRPRLMIFFASMLPDLTEILDSYNAVVHEDTLRPKIADNTDPDTLSLPLRMLHDKISHHKYLKYRMIAGETALEWARHKQVFGRVVGLGQIQDQVAKPQLQCFLEKKPDLPVPKLTLRTMQRRFTQFESIAHFAALQFLDGNIFVNRERRFTDIEVLGMAKTLEILIDEVNSSEGKGKGWDPIRVPVAIEPVPLPEFDADELLALQRSKAQVNTL